MAQASDDLKEVECQEVEARLRHNDLLGVVIHGRVGLGTISIPPRYKECKGKEKWRQVQQEVRTAVEEGRT